MTGETKKRGDALETQVGSSSSSESHDVATGDAPAASPEPELHVVLMAEVRALREALEAYRAKRAVDGLNGRTWNAAQHWKAEDRVKEVEANLAARTALDRESE